MPKKSITAEQGALALIKNPRPVKPEATVTERGFRIDKFVDRYGNPCSLQKSSLATEDAIWFGIDDPKPQIMVSDAIKMGRRDLAHGQDNGWCPWPVPDEVSMVTRMHLTQAQVKALLPALQHFVKTGDLP